MRSRPFISHTAVVGCAVLLVLSACGSHFTASAGSGGSGTSGAGAGAGGNNASGANSAGSGGVTSVAGGGGDNSAGASAAGAAGEASTGCDCVAGSYCQEGTTTCLLCGSFSRLQFAAPQKLATLSQSVDPRFPRAASKLGADLFYRSGAAEAEQVSYSATPLTNPGHQLAAAGANTSAPLLAPGVLQQNFFFDQGPSAADAGTRRQIMVGNWSGIALSGVTGAPAPLNGSASDYSIAVATSVARAYWMSTRNGGTEAQLLWAEMLDGTASMPAVLDLKVQAGSANCARTGDDATPWVNPAGTLLLFSNPPVDAKCAAGDPSAPDLYAVPLSKETGLPTTAAVPLTTLNTLGGSSDPSLSNDACKIYFASVGSDAALYEADRN